MDSLNDQLSRLFGDAFAACGYDAAYGEVAISKRVDFGDFQCNGALAASQRYQEKPNAIAARVIAALPDTSIFDELTIAGPGFINIRLSDVFVAQTVAAMAGDERLGCPTVSAPSTIVLDFGGQNVAKYMHVGHLRSSIIGDSLQRLFRFRGDRLIGDIHLGDWGTQMGMLIIEVERHYPDLPYFDAVYTGPYPAESPVTMEDLQVLYPAVAARCATDPEEAEKARLATKELHEGRPGYRALWNHFREISIAALREDLDRLGVYFDYWLGESDTQPILRVMVDELVANGTAVISQGATIIDVSMPDDKNEVPPLMLLKSDGTALYGTTDLATIYQRMRDFEADAILYVVDHRQSLHFEQVFRAAKKSGIAPAGVILEHLPFGTMNGPDGKPFKTRSGELLLLRELMQMVEEKARSRLGEMEVAQDYDPAERDEIARLVSLATLKFADLLNHRSKDYVFDLERFSSFEGRTGPYLLYTAVRIKSILRKAEEARLTAGPLRSPAGPEERELMLKLTQLPDVLARSYETRAPNHLADYVYNLAILFNRFYREYHILTESDPARQASWLALSAYTLAQLVLGLDLLGIQVPERM